MISVIDRKWHDHLYEMDYLKKGIGLRAMAQRDPLVEYQREGYVMFQQMMAGVREDAITMLFSIELQKTPDLEAPRPAHLIFSAPNEQGEVATKSDDEPESGSSFFKR